MKILQDLQGVIARVAHSFKILIGTVLSNTLKLERDYGVREAVNTFLDKFHLLTVQEANPSVRRMAKSVNGDVTTTPRAASGNPSTAGVMYGFRSLSPEYAGESPFTSGPRDPALSFIPVPNPPSDLCIKCNLEIKEHCVRLGTYERWHSSCVWCQICGNVAAQPLATPENYEAKGKTEDKKGDPRATRTRLTPANVESFVYELDSVVYTKSIGVVPNVIYCSDHAREGCRGGFKAVSCLEQYAFLLNVTLRRTFLLLHKRGVIMLTPASPGKCPDLFTVVRDTNVASHVRSNGPSVSPKRAGS
jgi:hypothetical protein